MTAEELRLQGADGVTIAADGYGDPASPSVVFLHGGGQSRSAWRGAARMVAEAGYYALSVDMRGHGASDWAKDGDYHFASYARDVAEIARPLGRVALVGASLGGRVAILAAARDPGLVAAIALADVAPKVDEEATREMCHFFRSTSQGFGSLEEAAASLSTLTESRPGPAEKLRPHMREEDGRLFWRWDPRFVDERFMYDPLELAELEVSAATLRLPVLMIRAELSVVVRPEHLAEFHALVPHAELAEAKGIGHMLTGDANDAYAPILLEFLERVYR
ncbi:alpha/beta fold hydrolase [soil metagenome]